MKRFFSILSVALVALSSAFVAHAEEVTLLTINLKDGSMEQFNLPDSPSVTFADNKMLVQSGEMSGEYDFTAVSHFSFEKGEPLSGIEEVFSPESNFSFSFTDNATIYVAAPQLKSVSLYSTTGTLLETVAATNGAATLNVSSLAPGVYIVAPSCHTAIKIVKH